MRISHTPVFESTSVPQNLPRHHTRAEPCLQHLPDNTQGSASTSQQHANRVEKTKRVHFQDQTNHYLNQSHTESDITSLPPMQHHRPGVRPSASVSYTNQPTNMHESPSPLLTFSNTKITPPKDTTNRHLDITVPNPWLWPTTPSPKTPNPPQT